MSGPTGVVSGPKVVVSGPKAVVGGPKVVVDGPKVVVDGPKVVVDGPKVVVDRKMGVVGESRRNSAGLSQVAVTAPAFCPQPKSFLALMTSKMGAGMSLARASSPAWILARTSPE